MMRRFWYFLTDSRRLAIIGFIALAAIFYLGAEVLELALIWALAALAATLLVAGIVWWVRRRIAKRQSDLLGDAIGQSDEPPSVLAAGAAKSDAPREEVDTIRDSMLKAIETIKGSKLGLMSGKRALYELPWYMIIGNPAAGKSSAITNSGLQFPFADGKIVQGVGGTRNCDWFFTTDGILLDTAGRYSVADEHRAEWFGFLDLLKKYRKRAPINGIIIAVSIAELRGEDPDAGLKLARSLRKRVQDLIERLEVFAPVYVVFTKADLIAGFGEFFGMAERSERERVWGATMAYKRKISSQQLMTFFDQGFDDLCDGLQEMSVANMGQQRRHMQPGVFTFPIEFLSIRAPVRAFIATLFEENPFQFKPVFRGFYFTSALQEGQPLSAQAKRVAERFELSLPPQPELANAGHAGFFLLSLFRKVIFADKDLVSQYASKSKLQLKYAVFFAATILLGLSLGGWSWSYLGNRQLVINVQADLDKVIKLQDRRLDLQSRLEALEIIQDRIEELEKFRRERPLSLRMGLYQGELLERKLREEYFFGVNEVMLKPVVANLETLLSEMNANADQLQPAVRVPDPAAAEATTALAAATSTSGAAPAAAANAGIAASAAPVADPASGASTVRPAVASQPYQDASPSNVEDAYNALKTYLMLVDKSHAEPSHLNDQLTRYWRGWLEGNRGAMPREQMIRSAERLMTFYLAQIDDPSWPRVEPKLALIDQARENLRRVVRGMPARERVYADIRARAATRYPSMTVARIVGEQDQALVAGSYAISGAYTREAWEKYVGIAFREAATHELQSADWVLQTASKDDLTLEGSPEQIQKGLVDLYLADKAARWGELPLHLWLRSVIKDPAAIADLDELLGAADAPR